MTALENRVPPPLLTLIFGAAMWAITATRAPAEAASFPVQKLLAIVIFVAAGGFGVPALRVFRQAGTTVDPVRVDRASALVTTGVYRVTRNPMYVSLTLTLVAWALWLGGVWAWAGPLALALWLDRLQIRPEERAMAARFGEEYARYRARVRRWI